MNIFHKVALQGLRKNRTRTLVTILGVILSAAMITAVASFGTSLLQFLVNSSIAASGNWHAGFSQVNSAFVQERTNDKEVLKTVSFDNIGYAKLDGAKSLDKPYFFIAGFHENTSETLPINMISGRLPEKNGEILVPSHVAVKGGVNFTAGDTLVLLVGSRQAGDKTLSQHDPYRAGEETLVNTKEKTYLIVGTYERPGYEEHTAPGYTLITKADATTQPNHLSLFVTLKNPRQVRTYADRAAVGYDYTLNDDVLRFMGVSENKVFNAVLYSVGGILTAIIMVGSIFLIYNSFNISLNERTQQFGILMSVGATAKQLRNSVLFEGICIGVIGIPAGIVAGIGSIGLLIPVIAANFNTAFGSSVPLTLSLSVPAIVAAAVISLITILISAYIPAKKATGTSVMTCIRQTNEIKTESTMVKTSHTIQRIYGLEGTLALKNFKRNKNRYRSIVLSLTLSMVLFVSGSTFGSTLKRMAEQYTVESDYDICFYTQDMDESEVFQLYDELRYADGIFESSYQAIETYTCEVNAKDCRPTAGFDLTGETVKLSLDIQFIKDDIYQNFIKSRVLSANADTGQDGQMIVVAKDKSLADLFVRPAMDFTLRSEAGTQTKIIHTILADTYPADPLPVQPSDVKPYVLMAVASYEMRSQFEELGAPAKMGLTFRSNDPSLSAADIGRIIESRGITSNYTLYNVYEVFHQYRSITFVVDLFTYVFVIMISLIAIANVFNTISTNMILRRRELAMLRSVGMSDRAFNQMMKFECIFYGVRTLVYGLPIAWISSWLIYKGMVMAERLDGFDYVFSWSSIIISVLGVFVIVFITMCYAARKIKKENIIHALREDLA